MEFFFFLLFEPFILVLDKNRLFKNIYKYRLKIKIMSKLVHPNHASNIYIRNALVIIYGIDFFKKKFLNLY